MTNQPLEDACVNPIGMILLISPRDPSFFFFSPVKTDAKTIRVPFSLFRSMASNLREVGHGRAHYDIEWTQQSWNAIVGCSILSPGCTNCYAMNMAARIEAMNAAARPGHGTAPQYAGTTKKVNGKAVWTGKLALAPDDTLLQPLRRKKPTTYFVNSMGDLFHEDVPDESIDLVLAISALCPQHTLQILTKRAARMHTYMTTPDRKKIIAERAMDVFEPTRPRRKPRRADQVGSFQRMLRRQRAIQKYLARCLSRTPAGSRRADSATAADAGGGEVHLSGAATRADRSDAMRDALHRKRTTTSLENRS